MRDFNILKSIRKEFIPSKINYFISNIDKRCIIMVKLLKRLNYIYNNREKSDQEFKGKNNDKVR